MPAAPHALVRVRQEGAVSWNLAERLLSTERRYRAIKAPLVRLLATGNARFAPELASVTLREREQPPAREGAPDPLQVYWSDLRRLRPTTRAEEFALARAIDLLRAVLQRVLGRDPAGAARALAFEYLSPYSPVLDAIQRGGGPQRPANASERRLALLQQRLQELHHVQSHLVARNLHLVPAAARRYSQFGVPWEDLIQEGSAALLRAVERYDRKENVRFAHYANCWIQQGVLKALSCQARTVRVPVYLAQVLHRVRCAQASSAEPLDAAELSRRTRVSVERVERALAADRPCLSMDRAAAPGPLQEADSSLAEQIADARPEPEPDAPGAEELRRTLHRLLERLPPREARILRLRFGLDDGRPRTLEEVRQMLGVSRERVRQLQAQSLRRLTQAEPRRALARFV